MPVNDNVAMSGWLDKQSPNVFNVSWQARYVILTCSDKTIRYFKAKTDAEPAGSIKLNEVSGVGPGEIGDACKIFAIKMQQSNRIYAFECTSHALCMTWIKTILGVKGGRIIGAAGVDRSSLSASGKSIKQGFLNKASSNILVLVWQKRLVNITADNQLRYYRINTTEENPTGDPEISPAGTVDCANLEYVKPKNDAGGSAIDFDGAGDVFELKSGNGKVFHFKADSTAEMFDWIQVIESCMPETRRSTIARLSAWGSLKSADKNTEGLRPIKETPSEMLRKEDVSDDDEDLADSAFGGYGEVDEDGIPLNQPNIPDSEPLANRKSSAEPLADRKSSAEPLANRKSSVESLADRKSSAESLADRKSSATQASRQSGVDSLQSTPGPGAKPEEFFITGTLKKESNNIYRAIAGITGKTMYQKRYVTISKHDFTLRYYKDAKAGQADVCRDIYLGGGPDGGKLYQNPNKACLGCMDLHEADFVRSFDSTVDCTLLEIRFGDRTFVFDAPSVPEKDHWIQVIAEVMKICANEVQEKELKRIESEVPPLVLFYDKEGREAFLNHIQSLMTEMYPLAWEKDGVQGANESSLSWHIQSYKSILSWLRKGVLPDVRKSSKRQARYDVMAITVDAVNRYLDLRLMLILSDDIKDDADPMQVANTEEVYTAITLLTEHQLVMNKLYCPVYFTTKSGLKGTRMSTNIRYSDTDFHGSETVMERHNRDSNETEYAASILSAANDEEDEGNRPRFDSESYQPGGLGRLRSVSTKSVVSDEERGIPVISPGSSGCNIHINSVGIPVYRFHCEIFEQIPFLCRRYVDGSKSIKTGASLKNGTGKNLVEHCDKVWEKMLVSVTEFVHRHQDGTFYTDTPTLMWTCLHQHLQLAVEAHSPLLHIMVADKISISLNMIVRTISDYVDEMDTSDDEELREMELEFLCALVNDNAMHIEEVMTLVETFSNAAVQERVNDSFDSVTDQLVRCGQVCLTRLVKIIVKDLERQYHDIYSEEMWLNGTENQVDTIAATVIDYMTDFEEFLMPFWYKKFSSMILEDVILTYISSLLKHSGSDAPEDCVGDMLTFSKISNDINALNNFLRKAMPSALAELKSRSGTGDGEDEHNEMPDLPQFEDINESNDYLVLMELLNELNFYLTTESSEAASHAMQRIAAFPSSSEAISWFFVACLGMREDMDEDEVEECEVLLEPAVTSAADAAVYKANHGLAEGHLGTLYDNLWCMSDTSDIDRDSGFGRNSYIGVDGKLKVDNEGKGLGNTVTHNLKMMTNVPLKALKESLRNAVRSHIEDSSHDDDDMERLSDVAINRLRANSAVAKHLGRRTSLAQLEAKGAANVAAIQNFLEENDEDENEIIGLEEGQADKNFNMEQKLASLQFKLENHMDKKSPSSKMWQRRFFKIITRINENIEEMNAKDPDLVSYILMYYKTKGDAVLKSFDLARVESVYVLDCERDIVWDKGTRRILVKSGLDTQSDIDKSACVPIAAKEPEEEKTFLGLTAVKINKTFTFKVNCGLDPKGRDPEKHELILRVIDVEKLCKWLSAFVRFGGLSYDEDKGIFTKSTKR